jgi:hypothetical protein
VNSGRKFTYLRTNTVQKSTKRGQSHRFVDVTAVLLLDNTIMGQHFSSGPWRDICRYSLRSNEYKIVKMVKLQDLARFGLSTMQNGGKFGVP